ncbi:MAG TPA: ATP-binding protein, partial [Polyangiaceae bacterium]
ASGLTAQLTSFAKGGAPARQRVELGPLVENTVALALRGSETRARFELAKDLLHTMADETQLSQVFTNLTVNARDAMRGEGAIEVRARNVRVKDGDSLLRPGPFVEIAFRDEGPGIEPSQADRIFDPFFTTKTAGTGLGLASSYSIVSRHGGALRVESTPGRGATFLVMLPAVQQERAAPVSERPRTSRPPAPTGKVLVMDDEPTLRKIISLCLTDVGYRVEQAADGARALVEFDRARREGDPFDAVILDLTIRGGMGGLDTLERLRSIDPGVRAIASSGYSDSPVLSDHERYGFVGALAKPFHFTMLVNLLRQVLTKGRKN